MRYYLGREGGKFVIRRWPGNARLPIKMYRSFRHDEEELKQFICRLNAPHDLRLKIEWQHAFINEALLNQYQSFLITRVPNEAGARAELSLLKRYALSFFIHTLGLINPVDWYAVSETKWAAYLLSKKCPPAAKTKRDIVNSLNRFVTWFHKRRPAEMPQVTFDPISKAKYREIESRREMDGSVLLRSFIPPHELKRICENAPEGLKPLVCLTAYYGLRRSEAVGLKQGDVKKGHLSVERQLKSLTSYGPTKGRRARKTPHWFATATQAYGWLESLRPIHPRTYSAQWDAYMVHLKLGYRLHDLRHTFITNAVRLHSPRDVQLAVGHKDLRVTMGYLHDDRQLDDDPFDPAA